MPIIGAKGSPSSQGFGQFAQASTVANYIEDVFSTYLYTGNGSTQTITNGIDLSGKGGMTWLKCRSAVGNNFVFDTTRGAGNYLRTNLTNAEFADTSTLSAFNSNGFSLGSNAIVNTNAATYASWTFRKQPKFFDVVTGTGGSSSVPHSLGVVPGCIIMKVTSGPNATSNWIVKHNSISTGINSDSGLYLNTTAATTNQFGNFQATATTIGPNPFASSTDTWVAYLFAHNAGGFGLTGTDNVISCGSYTGNGSATNGPTITLGYEPQWLLIKRATGGTGSWLLIDVMRNMTGSSSNTLYPNLSDAENANDAVYAIQPLATGFQIKGTPVGTAINTNGSDYIYIAIRRGPMKVPTSGTSVFSSNIGANLGSGGGLIANAGFPPDLHIEAWKDTSGKFWFDRLRGALKYIQSTTNAIEASDTGRSLANMIGMTYSNINNFSNAVVYDIRRAPNFFDEVCYTGNSTAGQTYSHNLGVAPELMIIKCRNTATAGWPVYSAYLGNTSRLYLQASTNAVNGISDWNSTSPTSSVFTVGQGTTVNNTGYTYVAYLFATCAGVSKVGNYTGTGATQTISCGFTGGARFVLIKRTDGAGDWYVWDTTRGMVSGTDPSLLLNTTAAEVNANSVYTTTGGFQIVSTAAAINASGNTYIYLAIA